MRCIKFGMLTGVTKFGKVSVFSDLNNLDDISMRNQYIDICGINEQELHDNLEDELHSLASAQGMTYDEICAKNCRSITMVIILRITLSVCIIRSVCSILLNIMNLVVIGLRPVLPPIW